MVRRPSRPLILRLSLGGAVLFAAGSATLAGLQPAAAAAFVARVDELVNCATAAACVSGTNTANGPGVSGASTNGFGVTAASTNTDGLYATSINSNGIYAYSSAGNGVEGNSANRFGVSGFGGDGVNAGGVFGEATYTGVSGLATGNGFGVDGFSPTGTGVRGQATQGAGVEGQTQAGYGVYASAYRGIALGAYSALGIGIRSDIDSGGFSVVGTSLHGQGNGADFEGGRFGIVGRAHTNGFPLVLTDSAYNNVFYVTGTGDVFYTGNFYQFSNNADGTTVSSFTAKSTRPTVEDTGSAQLTAGFASVTLDPSFAASVEKSTPYRVFITPDGDTRGLFVAAKTSRGFVVRETQGGRSNLAFDYRIVATSRGQAGKHMAFTRSRIAPNPPAASPTTALQIKATKLPAIPRR